MEIIIIIGIFVSTVLILEGGYFAFRMIRKPELSKVKRRLRTLSSGGYGHDTTIDIIRKKMLSEVPWLNRVLLGIPRLHDLDRLLEQSNARYTMGFYLLFSALLAFVGFYFMSLVVRNVSLSLLTGILLGAAPFLYLFSRKRKRMLKFERQLPDAIDLIVRALKAGHAFSGGLKMVAEEFEDPIGPEFDKTLDEINFGVGVQEALKNLTLRIDCPDLKFFVTSIILQRETGGNLAEILENLSYLIRERFKLHGKIRVLSAEGKMSAIILISLPFLVGVAISIINPKYISLLFTDPAGRVVSLFAVFMMAMGILAMKRIITIKV